MGRVDYSVSVHDARTGELDVQFSTSEVLSLDDMIASKQISGPDHHGSFDMNDGHPNSGMLTLPAGEGEDDVQEEEDDNDNVASSKIITTPGGQVAFLDPKSGNVKWIVENTFETPVAFAVESSSGSSIGVQVLPDAPNANQFSREYVSSELEKEIADYTFFGSVSDDPQDVGNTVFGALDTGQLFALPIGSQKRNPRMLGGLPHVPRLSSTAGSSKHQLEKLQLSPNHADFRPHVNEKEQFALALKRNICDPNSLNYPECILESYINTNHDDWLFNHDINGLLPPEQRFEFLAALDPGQKTGSNHNHFAKIMSSWLPPAIALLLVVSFELGRREKLKIIKNEASKQEKEPKVSLNDKQSESNVSIQADGVIDVFDEVLGFGGHGTVVYKGRLEGRHVAVKRMLKAYHESADREISLLIESDGHPNVVRYFLKEVRGDFVYLALELCDMNLQDLITVLAKNRLSMLPPQSKEIKKSTVSVDDATKQLLFEIASGVKHIHSLRIVHRDLKPANILLARKNRVDCTNDKSIYETFRAHDYIVKISDMGLGKQLLGQSSFGVSTMNYGVSKNEGSTIAGVGPGTVGWQAPEVMAYRLSPESPLLQEESGPESMREASPINVALNGRTSRSVDVFSLGCIFFCTVLPGSHPFGEWYEREANIMKNCPTIKALEEVTIDAADLVLSMLNRSPRARPTAEQICNHPFFWNSLKRLSFLCDLSDRIEISDTDSTGSKMDTFVIERNAALIVGTSWDTKLDPGFFSHVIKFRKYDPYSVRDCLRLIRNRCHHFDELPSDLKERICPNQEEMMKYFESLFPNLLMHCYNTCRENLIGNDTLLMKYNIPTKFGKDIEKEAKDANTTNVHSPSKHGNLISTPIVNTSPSNLDHTDNPKKGIDVPIPIDVVMWENSTAASTFRCRGWMRSEDEWIRRDKQSRKKNVHLMRCATDGKYRTRLCNHWDQSQGSFCPLRKKNKCDFAHGPIQLRVKEGKRNRWGKLVDNKGNNSNPLHSGGEDTYGAALSIESTRKEEGKWNINTPNKGKGRQKKVKRKNSSN